jgi:hypothetical protein
MGARTDAFRGAVVALITLSLIGCTSLRSLPSLSPASIRAQVQPGDDVRIVLHDNQRYELTVTKLEEESLTGRAASGKHYRVRYDAMQYLDVAEADVGGATGGIVAALYVVLAALFIHALVESAEPD